MEKDRLQVTDCEVAIMTIYDDNGDVDYLASLSEKKPRPGYVIAASASHYSLQLPGSVYSSSVSAQMGGFYSNTPRTSYTGGCTGYRC